MGYCSTLTTMSFLDLEFRQGVRNNAVRRTCVSLNIVLSDLTRLGQIDRRGLIRPFHLLQVVGFAP